MRLYIADMLEFVDRKDKRRTRNALGEGTFGIGDVGDGL